MHNNYFELGTDTEPLKLVAKAVAEGTPLRVTPADPLAWTARPSRTCSA